MMRSVLRRWLSTGLVLFLALIPSARAGKHSIIAEWEPALGTLIAWPLAIPCELVQALAEHERLWVLVASERVKSEAQTSFKDWRIPMDKVTFVVTSVESQWTRDYGPHQLFDEQGRWTLLDSVYINTPIWSLKPKPVKRGQPLDYFNQTFPGDDRTSEDLAQLFNAPRRSVEAYLTGGNFLVDGHGTAFTTRAMLDENNVLMSDEAFRALVKDMAGIDRIIELENTETWGIQHIDCWLKLLDAETLLVKRVPQDHPEYAPIQRNLAILSRLRTCYDRPYRIFRIDCPPYRKAKNFKTNEPEDWVPAYTNSLILNKRIYVPLFNTAADDVALKTYASLMPGYEVIGFPSNQWFPFDALHCRTRAIFDAQMVRLDHKPLRDQQPADQALPVEVHLEDHGASSGSSWKLTLEYRDEQPFAWQKVSLTRAADGSYHGQIPPLSKNKTWSYFIHAESSDGRNQTLPRTIPQGLFTFKTSHGP